MQKSRLTIIFAIVFVDILGFSLILPLIPFYAGTYGASATLAGLLVASYAAAQLIGAPVLGRLSDRYGRRPILLISILGTALGFVLLGVAPALGDALAGEDSLATRNLIVLSLLFASRILDGLTGGNISVARAYVADVTDETNRAKGMGITGAAFGLGFIIGPVIGGTLSTWGYAVPAFAAAILAAFNLIGVFIWLPESLTPERRAELARYPRPDFSPLGLLASFQRPRVGSLLYTRLFFGLSAATLHTIFPLYAEYRLGLDEQVTSYVLAYVGLLAVLVQGLAIRRLTDRFSESQLIMAGVLLMAPSMLGWAFAPSLLVLLIVLAPISLASGVLNTTLNSALSKAVYPEEIGGILGLAASLESVTRVLAPTAGGMMLQQWGTSAPGVLAGAVLFLVAPFIWRWLIAHPAPPLPIRGSDPHTVEAKSFN